MISRTLVKSAGVVGAVTFFASCSAKDALAVTVPTVIPFAGMGVFMLAALLHGRGGNGDGASGGDGGWGDCGGGDGGGGD